MIIVIIAGGSGTRLWPLSQGDHPKHLLSLTNEHSMLQNTYNRAKQMTDELYVLSEISQIQAVRMQLPDLDDQHLIVEPARRGTASCFVLALARLSRRHSADEAVVFLWADHHITDEVGFAVSVQAAAAASIENQSLAVVGIVPSHPSTGFGYIEYGKELKSHEGLPVYRAISFHEKPAFKTANQYLEAGNYLWNQGLFAAPINVWIGELKLHSAEYYEAYNELVTARNDLAKFDKVYLSLRNEAIDYALTEKTTNMVVVPGRYEWADIGSFFDLHKILKGKDGNTRRGDVELLDCTDSMVHGYDKPIIAIGLEGIVVVDTPDGLLVCAKEKSQLVKDALKRYEQHHAADK
jgi:mannose-1-phosphate guanylyltransferase